MKNSCKTIFKYALPSSIIDGVGGAIGAMITGDFLILVPVVFLMLMIYLLAKDLDLQKHGKRVQIIEYTEDSLYEISDLEVNL